MKYLVDTNVWLEALLQQQHAEEVRRFLKHVPVDDMAISLFALHSMGVVLTARGQQIAYLDFLRDLTQSGLAVLTIPPAELHFVVEACDALRLDFDDAYQYMVAERHDRQLVSFDGHFDHTPRGRTKPSAIVTPRD